MAHLLLELDSVVLLGANHGARGAILPLSVFADRTVDTTKLILPLPDARKHWRDPQKTRLCRSKRCHIRQSRCRPHKLTGKIIGGLGNISARGTTASIRKKSPELSMSFCVAMMPIP